MKKFNYLLLIISLVLSIQNAMSQMPAAISISPANATAYEEITLTFTPSQACFENGTLAGANSVSMHSGVNFINGQNWQHVVEFNAAGANGQQPDLINNGNGTFSLTFNPSLFYNFPAGSIVTHICAVFNNGTNWNQDGRDYSPTTGCMDFFIPLAYTTSAPTITFKVNMNKQIADGYFNPSTNQVYTEVLGFSDVPMSNVPDQNGIPTNIYSGQLNSGLIENQVLSYHFKTNTQEESLERTVTLSPGPNQVEHWFNNVSLAMLSLHCNMNYQINEGWFDPSADFLDVAGNFNNWDGSNHLFTDNDGDGIYSLDINPISSGIVEFKFRINGDWNSSEFPAGGPNRVLLIPLGAYSFSGIYDNFMPNSVPVTFNCIMEYQIMAQHFNSLLDILDIAGSYNGFLAGEQLMDLDGDEVYSLTIPIDTINSKTFTWQFRINSDWASCEFPDGSHRSYTVHNPAQGGPNVIDVWFADLDPFVGSKPFAKHVSIQPLNNLSIGTLLHAVYTYEDVNLDPEGETNFHWYRADNEDGLNPFTLQDDTISSYLLTEADAGKYIFLTITPKAQSESGTNPANTLIGLPVTVFVGPIWNLSADELLHKGLIVFPNPATDKIQLIASKSIRSVEVFDCTGKRILNLLPNSSNSELDVSSLNSGLYLIKIIELNGNTLIHKQLIH